MLCKTFQPAAWLLLLCLAGCEPPPAPEVAVAGPEAPAPTPQPSGFDHTGCFSGRTGNILSTVFVSRRKDGVYTFQQKDLDDKGNIEIITGTSVIDGNTDHSTFMTSRGRREVRSTFATVGSDTIQYTIIVDSFGTATPGKKYTLVRCR